MKMKLNIKQLLWYAHMNHRLNGKRKIVNIQAKCLASTILK